MEISGLDPKLTKCKFAVLPIKLYPQCFLNRIKTEKQEKIYLLHKVNILKKPINKIIRETTWTFMIKINEA